MIGPIAPQERLLFVGDSITDCGRRASAPPLGNGYVSLVAAAVAAMRPAPNLTILNRGISGDTTRDLLRRWQADVLAEAPDHLLIAIGINDVWRFMSRRFDEAVAVGEYEQNLRHLLNLTTETLPVCRIALLEPFLVEAANDDIFRRSLASYQAVLRTLAAQFDLPLVGLQGAFDAALAEGTAPGTLAGDRVHPTAAGHSLIARAFLAACRFELTPAEPHE